MHGGPQLAPHCNLSDPFLTGQRQGLETPEGFLRAVGMNRRHRSGMSRVEGIDQVESLGAPNFTNDDAVGAQPQRGSEQGAKAYRTLAFGVGRPPLQSDDMTGELQFRRVLDRDRALPGGHGSGQQVQERRLARPGASTDQDVLP
jgi:hypothetical protein